MSLFSELRRRNVFRVGIAYLVVGWVVLQVGDVVFALLRLPDWSLTLVAAILALGFIPTLVVAWVYELTPEGLKKDSEVDRSIAASTRTARKLDMATIALVVVGAGFLLLDRFYPDGVPGSDAIIAPEGVRVEPLAVTRSDPASEQAVTRTASTAPEKSIAVLPFVNMSPDPEQEYFSDGLAETLLHMLAQVDELRVAARTSSFQFKGYSGDVGEIAAKLNVAHVLEGSVRRAGNTVRISAQLIKADEGFHLWSGTYDRKLENIFAIQDEIAGSVVDALKVTLLGSPATVLAGDSTHNLDAYEDYLKGRQQLTHFSYESLPLAEAHFRRAIERDPDYLLAHVALAECYVMMANTGMRPWSAVADRVRPLAERVLELDPESGPGRVLLGYVEFGENRRPADTIPKFELAFRLAPQDDFVAHHFASMLRWAGDAERSAEIARQALARDPMSPLLHLNLAGAYNTLQRYDEALFHSRQVQILDPASPNGYLRTAESFENTGRFVDAVQMLKKAIAVDPADHELPADVAMNLISIGALDEAAGYLSASVEMKPGAALPIAGQVALSYRQKDYQGAALRALEAIGAGADPRRWAFPVFVLAVREQALRSGDHGLYLDHVPPWMNVDLGDGKMDGVDSFIKLISLPVLRASGQTEAVEAITAAVPSHGRRVDRVDAPAVLLALAHRDRDASIEAIRRLLRHGVIREWWLLLDSVALDFLDDDPRLAAIVADIEAKMAVQRQLLAAAGD